MAYFNDLYIEQYRGIKDLSFENLRDINIILGDNNCGKTSVLEAIQLFRSPHQISNMYRIARQRDALAGLNSNSNFESFRYMFPLGENESNLRLKIYGTCNDKEISFSFDGETHEILLDARELTALGYRAKESERGEFDEIETDEIEGHISVRYGNDLVRKPIKLNKYSRMIGNSRADSNILNIVYVAPFDHLRGDIIGNIVKEDTYKPLCIKALQLFDSDIEDCMIFRSDVGNRPTEYIRHKKLGNVPIAAFGDGIKKVLALSNAVARANNGILLIDEIETAIHKQYYEDIFSFIIKACKSLGIQLFITTHSLEAIDGLLATQNYQNQSLHDDICICTLKQTHAKTLSRMIPGREVFKNREEFGFEVRL